MLAVLFIALAFNLALGVSYVIIPLYAYHIGFSGVALGSLISLPMIVQIVTRFIGGAISDRFGEKRVLIGALFMIAISGVIFSRAQSFLLLLAAQLAIVVARGLFWPVIQSMVSRTATEINVAMGKLNAVNNAGQISGSVAAGFLVAFLGFSNSFLFFTLMGGLALLTTLWLKMKPLERAGNSRQAFGNLFRLLRARAMYFAILCSFIGAQPYSLGQSFYPILLFDRGFSPEAVGQILSLRPIGGIVTGLLLARWLRPLQSVAMPLLCSCGVALAIAFTPLLPNLFFLGFIILSLGIGSEVMALSYQVIATESSESNNRATALVVAGMGWSVAHLVTPIIFGLLVDTFTLNRAFTIWGVFLFCIALGVYPLQRYTMRAPLP
ncbi:MAG: MFS transporter [Syntrophales bacterium]|nr:MFS transporter [Syntrophales bacterium]